MKYYIRQIKPYIQPPHLQGFNDKPYPVEGYDWVPEDLEEELRKNIVVRDPWSELIFYERFVDVQNLYEKFEMPKINFEPLPDSSKDALIRTVLSHPYASCFLVYLKCKYSHETEWEYLIECCCLYGLDNIEWFNDWYEGQQDIEYLGIAVIDVS